MVSTGVVDVFRRHFFRNQKKGALDPETPIEFGKDGVEDECPLNICDFQGKQIDLTEGTMCPSPPDS